MPRAKNRADGLAWRDAHPRGAKIAMNAAGLLPALPCDGSSSAMPDPIGQPTIDHHFLQELVGALFTEAAILDARGQIIIVNALWKAMMGTDGRPGVGNDYRSIALFAGEDEPARLRAESLLDVLRGQCQEARFAFASSGRSPLCHYEMRAAHLGMGEADYVLVINEDVSRLHQLADEKRLLLEELIKSEEQERQRIAREMHDTTLQDFVAIGLNLKRLAHLAGDAVVDDVLAEVRAILKRAQQDVRTMSYLLHPPLLEEGGVVLATEALVRGFSNRTGLDVAFETNVCRRFPLEVELSLYRVVQEALVNVHRHAAAARVVVRYRYMRRRLMIEVEDDGIGFGGSDESGVVLGVGIHGMRARLQRLGGLLTIRRLVQGTLLRATVPIDQADGRHRALGEAGHWSIARLPSPIPNPQS